MEKLEYKDVCSFFISKDYKIIGKYKNANTYVLCENKDGYKCFVSYSNLKIGKSPILWGKYNYCNIEYNIQNFIKIKKADVILLSYKVVTKGKKNRMLLTLKCSCGEIYNNFLEDFIYSKHYCCNKCALKKRGIAKRDKTAKDFIRSHGYKILKGEDNYRKSDLFEVEDIDGYRGFTNYNKVKRGCSISRFDIRINKKYYIYNVNLWAEKNNLDVKCLDFYNGNYSRTGLKFKCSCGNEFTTSIASFQSGKFRCENCSKSISRLEFLFRKYLDEENIKYIYQYSLNQCRDILPLPFDFFLPDYNILIEIDGEGHYHPCHFNQISLAKAEQSFAITKKHDGIKTNFCKENHIKLIRVPYWYFNQKLDYKTFFQKSLNK